MATLKGIVKMKPIIKYFLIFFIIAVCFYALIQSAVVFEDARAARHLLTTFPVESPESSEIFERPYFTHHQAGNQELPEHHTASFLRQNNRRSSTGYLDAKTNQYIAIVIEDDFDASYDGKEWFHLLGRICLRGLNSNQLKGEFRK